MTTAPHAWSRHDEAIASHQRHGCPSRHGASTTWSGASFTESAAGIRLYDLVAASSANCVVLIADGAVHGTWGRLTAGAFRYRPQVRGAFVRSMTLRPGIAMAVNELHHNRSQHVESIIVAFLRPIYGTILVVGAIIDAIRALGRTQEQRIETMSPAAKR